MNIFLVAFLACLLSQLVVLALLRGYALWKFRAVVKQYGANDQIAEPPDLAVFMAQANASRPAPKSAADCQHPETWHYVLAVSTSPRNAGTIFWCRSCGSIKGWKPADDASVNEWQGPSYAPPVEEMARNAISAS